ncbi:MAG: site-specific integrase [Sporomusaceae bacterium]|nr:site-specific integrase [Sporomusaceae bacterium]
MTESNTVLNLQVLESDTDLDNVMIGSSKFSDDIWDLRPFIKTKTIKDSHKYLKFEYIANEDMKLIVKHYAYYKLGKIKPVTVKGYINSSLPIFIEYCSTNEIENFSDVTREKFLNFNLWIKDEKKMAVGTGFNISRVVEEIIKIGQIKGWDVPQTNLFKGVTSNQLWNMKKSKKSNKTKPIPEDVFDKILCHALHDEKDILTKAGIIIQSQTGLRINEVLSIQKGCVKSTADGYDYMEVTLGKTEKGEPNIHKVFINDLVKDVITEMTEATEPLRQKSGLKELFLTKSSKLHGKVVVYKIGMYGEKKLNPFVRKWNIQDNKGNLYPLTSHQFRATFVRELVKRKVPIAHIMKQYSHVSVEMTAHYLTLEEEEVKEIYSDMILSPKSKIAGLRAKEIKGKMDDFFHGKTENEINETISKLSKSMSFNALPTGVCLYDFRRGNCSDGDGCFFYNCPNYITEVTFYPILKSELDLLEKEIVRLKELGYERERQKQYVKYKYLKPLVDSLEVQLDDKESAG